MPHVETFRYAGRKLQLLDQTLLPGSIVYVDIVTIEDGYDAIKSMKVRGAPAIAIAGALTLAVTIESKTFDSRADLESFIEKSLAHLVSARPTAVNIFRAANDIRLYVKSVENADSSVEDLKESVIKYIEAMLESDVNDNMAIGKNGAEHMLKNINSDKLSVLTHCNAGALATAGYGTAVGVIRALHEQGKLNEAFCTETRAYNQGARLTAFELVHEGIKGTLIIDSAVSIAMQQRKISSVVVGADRVASNGDTANKIGTFQIAIAAKYHNIPFYVAAPFTSIDPNINSGVDITIEERNPSEITHFRGERMTPEGINCWNPAFDITPADLITGGIITERGVFNPHDLKQHL